MKTPRLRTKLLIGAVAISMMLALAYMSAVSWIIRQQHLNQSNALLLKASGVIAEELAERKAALLTASRQLATQKNLGSTIWYLTQYARSNLDRDTLFNTYQQLVRDTYKTGRDARVAKIAIYNSAGILVSFALFDRNSERAGFVERSPDTVFQIATLKDGDGLIRKNLHATRSIAGMDFEYGGRLPQQEGVRYTVADGMLSIESHVPIMGEAFDPASGKPETRQLGLVTMVQPLNQSFVNQISQLTDTKVNVFTPQGLGDGSLPAYRKPDWSSLAAHPAAAHPPVALSEITIGDTGYYQGLIPLYNGNELAGGIAALQSKKIVLQHTWEMIRTLWLIAIASSLFVIPFAWYFAATLSRPLDVLNRIFRRIASSGHSGTPGNELDLLVKQTERQDELGDLAQSFIAMNDAIEQKIRQINEINASLEKTVEERTSALVAREQEARTLIENSPDTIARYDRECRRVFVNSAFGALAEGGTAALLGSRPSEHPGGANSDIYEAKIRQVFATGENTDFELKWPGRDGTEYCSHIRLAPEFDLSGNVATVLGVGRDITELNRSRNELTRTAEALRKNDELLRESQRISGMASYVLHIQTGQLEGSDMLDKLFGIDASYEHTMAGWFARLHPDERASMVDYINNEVLGQGRIFDREYRIIRLDDQAERWLHVLGKLELDAAGQPLTIHGTVQDITERKLAIQQLEEKELAKTRFLAAAGHDLRQPLAAANLFIDALKFTAPTPAQEQVIQRLEQAMSTFNGLLDTLLNISRLDAGIIRPEYASINVTELMNWLEQNFAPLAAEKKLGFRLHFSMREALVVRSDIGLVKSVLMNLVSNALKFTARGAILISARKRGSGVLFQVWDTGKGIGEDNLDRIFDEFYQVDNPQRDRSRGLGLGLPIVKRALTLLGGRVTVRSRAGHGSVFGFLLPTDAAADTLPPQSAVADAQDLMANHQFASARHFVVVEDDTLVAQAMINLLEGMGGKVSCFHSAEQALSHPHIDQADCYIADYMLGGSLSGIQFLNQLHRDLGRPIIAVLVTGDTSTATLRHIENCAWPVLHKPVNTFQLISSLRMQASNARSAV